jgi:hypothetical protein
MTRHGTLAYYLAAWIVGCPIVALVFWLMQSVQTGSASSSALLEICFFALMCGVADSLLFAFLLRRAMHLLQSRNIAVWGLAGAVLSFALVFLLTWTFGKLGGALQQGPSYFLTSFIFAGPDVIWHAGSWQAPLDGAGIGAVLSLIDRAFNRVEEGETTPRAGEPAPAPAGQSPA